MLTKTLPLDALDLDGDGLLEGEFRALVSVFGNVDSDGDRVMPGAFAKTLADWQASGDPIPVVWSHQWFDPFAHIGHVLKASETSSGLEVHAALDLENPTAAQVHRLLTSRRVTQFSFAYDVVDGVRADDGAYDLRELALHEVGPALRGANAETDLLAAKAVMQTGEMVLTAEQAAALTASKTNAFRLRARALDLPTPIGGTHE